MLQKSDRVTQETQTESSSNHLLCTLTICLKHLIHNKWKLLFLRNMQMYEKHQHRSNLSTLMVYLVFALFRPVNVDLLKPEGDQTARIPDLGHCVQKPNGKRRRPGLV